MKKSFKGSEIIDSTYSRKQLSTVSVSLTEASQESDSKSIVFAIGIVDSINRLSRWYRNNKFE